MTELSYWRHEMHRTCISEYFPVSIWFVVTWLIMVKAIVSYNVFICALVVGDYILITQCHEYIQCAEYILKNISILRIYKYIFFFKIFFYVDSYFKGFPGGSDGKESACNARGLDSSLLNLLQYCFCFMLCFCWPRERDLRSSARITPAALALDAKS